ncbi:hypothetical protein ACTXT7_010664 [Hymenolepis weldensis]
MLPYHTQYSAHVTPMEINLLCSEDFTSTLTVCVIDRGVLFSVAVEKSSQDSDEFSHVPPTQSIGMDRFSTFHTELHYHRGSVKYSV